MESNQKSQLLDRLPPDDYLSYWNRTVQLNNDEIESPAESVLIFRLGKYWFAWPLKNVETVTDAKIIKRIPHRDTEALLGTIKVLGYFHLVISLEYILKVRNVEITGSEELSFGRKSYPRMIYAKYKNQKAVFPVNDIAGIYYLLNADLNPPSPSKAGKTVCFHCKGMFDYRQKNIIFLDKSRIFESVEGVL